MSHQDLSPQGWAPKIQKKGRTLIAHHMYSSSHVLYTKCIVHKGSYLFVAAIVLTFLCDCSRECHVTLSAYSAMKYQISSTTARPTSFCISMMNLMAIWQFWHHLETRIGRLVKTPDMIRFKYNISGSWQAFFSIFIPLDSKSISLHILKISTKTVLPFSKYPITNTRLILWQLQFSALQSKQVLLHENDHILI